MKTAKTSGKITRGSRENKTLRFTPRTLFDLEFWAPLERQTETGLVEAALAHYIKHVVSKRHDEDSAGVWDPEPAVRTLRMFRRDAFPYTREQDVIRSFVFTHAPFFYEQDGSVKRNNAILLWGDPSDPLAEYRSPELVLNDFWEPGRRMAKALKAANLAAPTWPPKE